MLKHVINYLEQFLNLCNEMSPYLLLGFIFAGILHVYIKKEHITKYLGKRNLKSVINAALIGVPLPLCSCGVIPTGVSFSKNGATKGAAVSFLISTPQTGVDSMLVTYSLLGLPFAIIRPIVALITGIFGGAIANATDKEEPAVSTGNKIQDENETGSKFNKFLNYAFVEFLQDISKWLIIGLAFAALISVVLPEDFFTEYINSPILSMFIVLIASIPLYVCATGSVPIAAVLMLKGLSPGAALVFLMAGPATNMATITVIGNSMGKKSLFAYLASIIGGALFFGFIIDYIFPSNFFTSSILLAHEHSHLLPMWFKTGSTILLGLLIINGYIQKYRNKTHSHTHQTKFQGMETIKIKVEGMTCNHCKANVEKNIKNFENISQVEADIVNNIVEIAGENINLEQIENTVNGLGYSYKGKV